MFMHMCTAAEEKSTREKFDTILGKKASTIGGMKVSELKAALRDLGIQPKGKKADLQKQLLEATTPPPKEHSSETDSESDAVSMDDSGCEDTDYENFDCSDEKCACKAAPEGDHAKRKATIKLWLAADYKFLLVVLGFKGATGHHACIYCKADLSNPSEWKKVHDLDERKADDPPDADHGQPCKNLFPFIPRIRCRIDVLHLLLRCMDRYRTCPSTSISRTRTRSAIFISSHPSHSRPTCLTSPWRHTLSAPHVEPQPVEPQPAATPYQPHLQNPKLSNPTSHFYHYSRFIHTTAVLYLRCWMPNIDKDEDKLKVLNKGLAKKFAAAAGQGSITFAEKTGSKTTWKLTRVNGNGYKKILENFKFAEALPKANNETAQLYQEMWDTFRDIYQHINTPEPWDSKRLSNTIRSWFASCLTISETETPFDLDTKGVKVKKNDPLFLASYLLTPYFHCLLCHISQMIEEGEIFSFSGQPFEKCNHIHQRIQAAATNHIVGEDSKAVAQQHLRIRMNTVGTFAAEEGAIPCDMVTCTSHSYTPNQWIAHRKRHHGEEVKDESLAASMRAADKAQQKAATTLQSRMAVTTSASFIRDTNDAFNSLLCHDRELKNTNYETTDGAQRKKRRQAAKENDEFAKLQSTPAPPLLPGSLTTEFNNADNLSN